MPESFSIFSLAGLVSLVVIFTSNDLHAEEEWKPKETAKAWKYLVLHHTATSSGSVSSIHNIHRQRLDSSGNRWLGIGYHFVIGNGEGMPDGKVEPTFRWHKQLAGAHAGVSLYNEFGIGICLVGNFEQQKPSQAQLKSLERLVAKLRQEFGISTDSVIGHGQLKATACPGHRFPMERYSTYKK